MITAFKEPDQAIVSVRDRFTDWVKSFIIPNDAVYHIDDTPHDIVFGDTGEPLFSKEVADAVQQTIEKFRVELGNDELWEVYFPLVSQEVGL